jgi:hypothetical protein
MLLDLIRPKEPVLNEGDRDFYIKFLKLKGLKTTKQSMEHIRVLSQKKIPATIARHTPGHNRRNTAFRDRRSSTHPSL